jgi:hypothetical protein
MKMKTSVEMMNVVARKSRLGRVVVLLGVGLSALRSILLPALLLFCAHLVKGEILEYQVEFNEGFSLFVDEESYNEGEWKSVAKIILKAGEKLSVSKDCGIIRQLRIYGEGLNNQHIRDPELRLRFTNKYLGNEIEMRYYSYPQTLGGKRMFVDGEEFYKTTNSNDYLNDIVTNNDFLTGPAEIAIEVTPLRTTGYLTGKGNTVENKRVYVPRQLQTIRLNKSSIASTSSEAAANKNILVLPKGSGVNELILESSEDLITWEKDVPGDKNTDAANRFYRLRAVKK